MAAALRRVLPTISRQLASGRHPLPSFAGAGANTAAQGTQAVQRMVTRSYRTGAAWREGPESLGYQTERNNAIIKYVSYGSFGALCYAVLLDYKRRELRKARRNNH